MRCRVSARRVVVAMPRARRVVVVLCGVPGSGKTTFARAACEMLAADAASSSSASSSSSSSARSSASWRAHHVCVDACEREVREDAGAGDAFDAALWRSARTRAFERARALLRSSDDDTDDDDDDAPPRGSRTVVFADDNNYYASMRWEWYQIARECGAACVCAYVVAGGDGCVDARVARERNATRAGDARVPDDAFRRVCEKFEAPTTESTTTSAFPTVRVDTHARDFDVRASWASIVAAWGAAPKKLRAPEALEAAREETRRNAAHAVDVRSRKAVSRVIARADALSRARVASDVNAARRELLARARRLTSPDDIAELERAFYATLDVDVDVHGA